MSSKPARPASRTKEPPPGDVEAARRASEESLRSFIDNAVFGIYRSAVDGRVLMMNRTLATMLGYGSPDELMGADLAATVYQDPAERERLVQQHRAGDRYAGVESVWKRKDGKPVPVRLSGRVLHDGSGAVAGFEGIVEDLSERPVSQGHTRVEPRANTCERSEW